ncbi:MAG: glycoside-pentoside-hexuronide (GPH):cation symporter [Clostridiales bacterium]|jgi:melibiose permease/lactose/raffinose/galactose permease|nr:glycoside-pentoside-hexuronide (GPH):cation symporter [Clostridiales bacterium]
MDENNAFGTSEPSIETQAPLLSADTLSRRNLWSFALGTVGRDMAYSMFNSFILTYILFTKSLTAPQFGAVSAIIIACRVFDALNDPIMGTIVENTRSRFGKFKPWILIGAITCAVVVFATFSVPVTGWTFVVFLGFIYFLFSITYTMNDISYYSMLPALAKGQHDRNKLTSLTNLCGSAGGAAIGFLVPTLTAGDLTLFGSAPKAYMTVALFAALMFIAFQVLTVVGVKEKAAPVQSMTSAKLTLKDMVKIIKNNDQLLWIALISLIYNVGSNVFVTLPTTYIYFEFGYNGLLTTFFGIFSAVVSTSVTIFFPLLAKRFSRKKMMASAIIGVIIGYSLILLFGLVLPQPAATAGTFSLKFVMLMIANVFNGYGQCILYLSMTLALVNTIEYNEWKTGSRNESVIFSIRPFMAKLGSALSQLVITLVLLIVGVTVYTNKISDIETDASKNLITGTVKTEKISEVIAGVPDGVKIGLLICMTLIPLILLASAYTIYRTKYKIDEKKFDEMVAEIKAREAAKDSD